MNIPDKCPRCGGEMGICIMSRFNTQMICMDCVQKEEKHPDYAKAKEAELKALKRGDYNFKGIGKPSDL